MKTLKVSGVLLAIMGIFGFILFNNKKEIDAKAAVKVENKEVAVTVAKAAPANLSEGLEMIGTFEPYKSMTLVSEIQGKVISVGVEEGSAVQAGSFIAQTDNELIRAELMAAEASFLQAQRDVVRYENLRRGEATTDMKLEESRLALKNAESRLMSVKKQLKNTTIAAPIAGTITKRHFEQGSVILPGTQLVDIVDISRLKLRINVPEKDVFKYRKGEKIALTTDVYPGKDFNGIISLVGVQADQAHNYPVEVLVSNTSALPLKAGMYGRAATANPVRNAVLTIPRVALVGSVKNPQVFVVEGNQATLRDIGVGASSDQLIEVISGLKEGETVVTSGQVNLEKQSIVKVVK
jgi:RND family efflux transporter MFP subunit